MTGGGSMTISRRRYKVGRSKRRSARQLFNAVVGTGSKLVVRWQQISPSLLAPGRLSLGWQFGADPTTEWMPIHFMSISQCPVGLDNGALGCLTTGIKKVYMNTTSGNWFTNDLLGSQNSAGDTVAGQQWQLETADGGASSLGAVQPAKKVFHSWTDIRFQLYGCTAVPITYTVYVMQMKEQVDPQQSNSHAQGTETANLFKDMVRPLCGNPLNMNGRIDWPKDVRIVKKLVRTIQPLNYSDQSAATVNPLTKTSHVEQVRLFMRHDRYRDYNWHQTAATTTPDNNLVTQGWDVNNVSRFLTDCEWGKKLYLFITATSPRREAFNVDNQYFADSDLNWTQCQGSYDILVRNKFMVTPG